MPIIVKGIWRPGPETPMRFRLGGVAKWNLFMHCCSCGDLVPNRNRARCSCGFVTYRQKWWRRDGWWTMEKTL